MKNLKETLNEARNIPYSVQILPVDINDKPFHVTITLEDPKDAKVLDRWFEEQLDNSIIHAEGGPNDIEI